MKNRRSNISLWSFFLSIIFFVLLILIGCSNKKSEGQNQVTIAFLPINASSPLFVAIENKIFEQENISVKILRVASANDALSMMLSGRADVVMSIGFTSLFTLQNNDPKKFRIIQSAVETDDYFTSRILVPKSSKINSLLELKGKTIGTYNGLTQLLNLKLILEANNLIPDKDIKIVQVDEKLQIAGLTAGRFDALFTIDPYATLALNEGIAKSISDSPRNKYILSPFPTCATIVSQNLINKNPETVRKIISALDKAIDWSEKNPTEVADIIANEKYTSLTRVISRKAGTYLWWKFHQEKKDVIQKLADIMLAKGLLDKQCKVDSMFLSNI